MASRATGVLLLGALLLAASTARAQDPFEVQVYDAEVLPFGASMEELHLIVKPSVQNPAPGVAARDPGLLHATLEPQLGLGGDVEAALYVETALWPDGSYHVSGAKARAKWKAGFSRDWPVHLALNAEIGNVDTNSDAYAWAAEIRTIAEGRAGPCHFFANVNLGVPLGHDWRVGPQLEPALKGNCTVAWDLAPGLEYYAALGPVVDWAPVHQQLHYLYYTLDFYRWPKGEINLGVGEPLTVISGPWVLNLNLGLQLP